MTSNIGSREATERGNGIGFGSASRKLATTFEAEYRRAMERSFAPEFLNRIDEVILFDSLAESDAEAIVKLEVDTLRERLQRIGYTLRITPSALRDIAQKGFSSRYGARALRRTMVEHIEEPISAMIVSGELLAGDTVIVGASKGGITIKRRRGIAGAS